MRMPPGGFGDFSEPATESTGSLTHFEIRGLDGALSLADGHASHELKSVDEAISRFESLHSEARRVRPASAAREMILQWALIAGEPNAASTPYIIGPTASISIDIVAAAARQRGKRVLLVEPTFDNLSQILHRRGVEVSAVLETQLRDNPLEALAGLGPNDALFLVDPNNPTGTSLDAATLDAIFTTCANQGVAVIIDRTFRFFGAQAEADLIGRLTRSGVSFVLIEDTGKTWPTLETKASPTFYSPDWDAIRAVFEEIFLSPPALTMLFFADLFKIEGANGFPGTLHALVAERRAPLRALISETAIHVAPESEGSKLPVEWLDISDVRMSDVALVNHIIARTGVHLLPGRQFFWSRGDLQPQNRIRVSLLRPQLVFDESIARLEAFLREGV